MKKILEAYKQGKCSTEDILRMINSQTNANAVNGDGAMALGDGISSGAGGVAVGGDIHGNVQIHLDQSKHHEQSIETNYLNRLISETGYLSLEGIDPVAVGCDNDARLNLASIYTALLTDRSKESLEQESFTHEKKMNRLSALDLLNKNQHLVLLGEPGSGKTTFVNFLAFCMAGQFLDFKEANLDILTRPLPDNTKEDKQQQQRWDHGVLLPVRIILRDFAARGLPQIGKKASSENLWTFITDELKSASLGDYAHTLRETFYSKGGLLLLDGLDEVTEANKRREQIKQVVTDFVKTFHLSRVLVTSRTYAYQQQHWKLPGFDEAVLSSFTQGQIFQFIESWYHHIGEVRNLNKIDANARAKSLQHAISNSKRLTELAGRPLLLTLMAGLHAWRGGELPEKREELYSSAVDLLLYWWEKPKIVTDPRTNEEVIQPSLAEWLKIDRTQVRKLLNELAFDAHNRQSDIEGTEDIPEKELVNGLLDLSNNPDVKPVRLIEYLSIRTGLIIPRGIKIYTFHHRTFQEYLAACHLTDNNFPETMAELARNAPDRWREVALLAGAKAARGSESLIWSLADSLCYHQVDDTDCQLSDTWGALLAGQALIESADLKKISPPNKIKFNRICQWLVKIIQGNVLPAKERERAGRILAVLGDPRPQVTSIDQMEFCLVPEGEFWMGSDINHDPNSQKNEQPLHEVYLKHYCISRYPVTNAQYMEFVNDGGYVNPLFWSEANVAGYWKDGMFKGWLDNNPRNQPENFGHPFILPNHPVVGVTWYEALAFTRWLSEKWNKLALIQEPLIIRLPTEAEWEKAARGGKKIVDSAIIGNIRDKIWLKKSAIAYIQNENPLRIYPWGHTSDQDKADFEKMNAEKTGIGTTNAVGCFFEGASPYGVLEMIGNAWEWTHSLDKKYHYVVSDGREDEKVDKIRIVRGGSYFSDLASVRCARRNWGGPGGRDGGWSFRVVLAPSFSDLCNSDL